MNHKMITRFLIVLVASILGVIFIFLSLANEVEAIKNDVKAQSQEIPTQFEADAYLILTANPVNVTVSDIFTVHISYHNIGLPYTYFSITPTHVITFEPPIPLPCKYSDPGGCTAVSFRALAPGAVHIFAYATGEVFEDSCQCWVWSGGASLLPATVIISGTQTFLPILRRDQ